MGQETKQESEQVDVIVSESKADHELFPTSPEDSKVEEHIVSEDSKSYVGLPYPISGIRKPVEPEPVTNVPKSYVGLPYPTSSTRPPFGTENVRVGDEKSEIEVISEYKPPKLELDLSTVELEPKFHHYTDSTDKNKTGENIAPIKDINLPYKPPSAPGSIHSGKMSFRKKGASVSEPVSKKHLDDMLAKSGLTFQKPKTHSGGGKPGAKQNKSPKKGAAASKPPQIEKKSSPTLSNKNERFVRKPPTDHGAVSKKSKDAALSEKSNSLKSETEVKERQMGSQPGAKHSDPGNKRGSSGSQHFGLKGMDQQKKLTGSGSNHSIKSTRSNHSHHAMNHVTKGRDNGTRKTSLNSKNEQVKGHGNSKVQDFGAERAAQNEKQGSVSYKLSGSRKPLVLGTNMRVDKVPKYGVETSDEVELGEVKRIFTIPRILILCS